MPGLLLIAHAPLASSLRAVAAHTFPEQSAALEALDVTNEMSPEEIERRARQLLERVRTPEALILTDVFGATPCNVAQRLAGSTEGGGVKVLAGVNVPMLWRTLGHLDESLDLLIARAVAGGTQGVIQVATSRPQNQAFKATFDDQDHARHQQ